MRSMVEGGRSSPPTPKPEWPRCPNFTAKAATSSTSAPTAASTTDGRPLRQGAGVRTQDALGHLPPQGPRQGHARTPTDRRTRPPDRRAQGPQVNLTDLLVPTY